MTELATPIGANRQPPAGFDALVAPPSPGAGLPVDEHWTGFGGAHGGLMIAALGRAMQAAAGRPLRAIHADLLGGIQPGELSLQTAVERAGRTVSFASATGHQDGALRIRATGVLGDGPGGPLGRALAATDRALAPPSVPRPEALDDWRVEGSPALRTVQFRPASDNLPIDGDHPEFLVWLAILDDQAPLDPWRLLTLADAPPPGLYGIASAPFAVPTVEFGAQLLPAAWAPRGRWALARMRTVWAADGWSVDDCELWDEAGAPLLLSRQTRRIIG
jgi:Thioesterase-like superfamily